MVLLIPSERMDAMSCSLKQAFKGLKLPLILCENIPFHGSAISAPNTSSSHLLNGGILWNGMCGL